MQHIDATRYHMFVEDLHNEEEATDEKMVMSRALYHSLSIIIANLFPYSFLS
jgi:hypothetical protein